MKKHSKCLILCGALLAAALCCTSCAPAGPSSEGSASGVSKESETAPQTEPESAVLTTEAPSAETTAPAETTQASGTTAAPPAQTLSRYKIGEGTEEENEVVKIVSENPGPTVYIVGGIHGDELAGWNAANRLKDELKITAGTVYILSPANLSGAEAETRFVTGSGDLNRAFPGDASSDDAAHRIAAVIFSEIKDKAPDLLLDLHEARYEVGGEKPGGLANCLIYTDDTKIADLLFTFVEKNDAGELCSEKFALTVPGKTGSINRNVTDLLGIPSITTETIRGKDLELRVKDQIDIVHFCLAYYGMMDPE